MVPGRSAPPRQLTNWVSIEAVLDWTADGTAVYAYAALSADGQSVILRRVDIVPRILRAEVSRVFRSVAP